ncbi:hypothetical protein J2755_002072 [Methanohalophilus levihalophilus]|uniref:VPXXXP-CTERM sorting domain-containing protein n=1 Tax=Methanohalophilus levihalophilus TaxID=1431282 RepID=UPI001AE294F6|nr:VPXXXP-CTERM sorting domain-containing protein [Methanohalophilus levihalophilus]MBP2031124.1 hypothetical protein [Methanohalophilus levihalophilus]
MKEMKLWLTILMVLALVASVPAASAITVDGIKDPEWNDNWAFGQTNNATAAGEYDVFNTGNRLEVRQGAFDDDTTIWNAEDPKNDSGTSHDETMATEGDSSGQDIMRIYGHYDFANDTLFGMTTVYGIPGDLDGDGSTNTIFDNRDTDGNAGPAGLGLGQWELWTIRITQTGSPAVEIDVQDNDWAIIIGPLAYSDVEAAFSPTADGVYEIAISDASEIWDIGPCQEDIMIEVRAGGTADTPGEDTATAFVHFTCPDIMIKKYVSADNSTWFDANTKLTAPVLENNSAVYWRYVVTNTGDEPLTSVSVTDDIIGFIGNIGDLDVNEEATLYASGTVPRLCTDYTNIGTTNGVGAVSGIPVTDNDPANYLCEPPEDVPAMTPIGLIGLIGALGLVGIVAMKRRE